MAPPFTRPLHPCAFCGKETRKRVYCDRACYGAAERAQVPAVFWSKVAKTAGCWEWQGSRQRGPRPYGKFGSKGGQRTTYAHRVAYLLTKGPIPPGLVVMHLCDNPPCVNPDHLVLGTNNENMADMAAKGRQRSPSLPGPTNPSVKLTLVQVEEIRRRAAAGEMGKHLAAAFGVGTSQIARIINRQSWREVA